MIIFNELVLGKFESKLYFVELIEKYVWEGVEGVILGCIEFLLVIKFGDVGIEVFDSVEIYMRVFIEKVME